MDSYFRPLAAFRLTAASKRELSLDVLDEGNYVQASKKVFITEDGDSVVCMRRKFYNLQRINEMLKEPCKFYLYKLHKFDKYGLDLQPTGEQYYELSYAKRSIK